MARGQKKKKEEDLNPEVRERQRLKKLAFSNNILSEEIPGSAYASLSPSQAVAKHHGKDILKKSQRKNKYLFSFPGLLAPIGGGKIGDLKDLGTKNPILYLNFPQGRMKLFGTIVYPKNRYLTLLFPRGGKNVTCEDYFDNLIVFSEAWWIGTKDENPEEAQLDFPKELNEGQHIEYDFKGGAGAASVNKPDFHKNGMSYAEEQSPKAELQYLSDGENKLKDLMEATPVRQSERTAGKRFNFTDASPGDDSIESDADVSIEEKKVVEVDSSTTKYNGGKTENLCSVTLDVNNEDAIERTQFPEQNQESAMSESKSKKLSHGSLVQATISTLFKKVEEKKAPKNPRKSLSPKVSDWKLQHINSKRKINEDEGPRKKGRVIKGKDAGGRIMAKKKQHEIEDDDIEEISSSSQEDSGGSDEDWAA